MEDLDEETQQASDPKDGNDSEMIYAKKAPKKKRKKKGKPKLTVNNITKRVMNVPALQVVCLLLAAALVLTFLYAVFFFDLNKEGGPSFQESDDPSFLYKYSGILATFCFHLAALGIIYNFLSVQYRRQYKRDENGKRKAVVPKPPKAEGKKLVFQLSALVPLLLVSILIFSLYSTVVSFQYWGEDFYAKDNYYNILHRARIFLALALVLIPLSLLLATAGTTRGLKRTGKRLNTKNYMVLVIVSTLVLAGLSFVFAYTLSKELRDETESFINSDWEDPGWKPDLVNESVGTYFKPLANLFAAFSFILPALALSNLRRKRPQDYRITMTPSFMLILVGFALVLLNVIINLTILNFKDFDFENNLFHWYTLTILFGNFGFIFMLGGTGGLMVEHSLHAPIKEENLWLPPETLWGEMKKKNLILKKLL